MRQLNPIANVTQTLGPANLPCNYRPTYYNTLGDAWGIDSMNDVMQNQTPQSSPNNNWRDNITTKRGYYNQYEHTNN